MTCNLCGKELQSAAIGYTDKEKTYTIDIRVTDPYASEYYEEVVKNITGILKEGGIELEQCFICPDGCS